MGCQSCEDVRGGYCWRCYEAVEKERDAALLQNEELQKKLALVEKMNADNAKMRTTYLDEKARAERLLGEALDALKSIRAMAGSHTIPVPDLRPAGYGRIYETAEGVLSKTEKRKDVKTCCPVCLSTANPPNCDCI